MEKIVREAYVVQKQWGPEDGYLTIEIDPIQVFKEDGYKSGDRVKVLIEVIRK